MKNIYQKVFGMSKIIIDTTVCFECEAPVECFHHVIPRSKGGKMTIPLCNKCHGLVHDMNMVKSRTLAKEGIRKAKERGVYLGRKKGTKEDKIKFLSKHQDIVSLINKGVTVRSISKQTGKSSATVIKVKKSLVD